MPARPVGAPVAAPQPARISRLFRDVAPAILWLALSTGEAMGVTPTHEVWSYEHGWTEAQALAVGDTFAGAGGEGVAVVDFFLDRTPTPVYNFEVEGDHTYFAAGVWVHNNSCRRFTQGAFDLFNVRKLPDSQIMRRPPRRGLAPKGVDGYPVEIHHVGQNPNGPFEEILKVDHGRTPNPNRGLTDEERRLFDAARKRHWEREWDAQRIADIPE